MKSDCGNPQLPTQAISHCRVSVNEKYYLSNHVWSRGTDPAGRAKHFANAAFISAPIPATPYSQTLCASADILPDARKTGSQPRGHFQPHLRLRFGVTSKQGKPTSKADALSRDRSVRGTVECSGIMASRRQPHNTMYNTSPRAWN